MASTDTRRIVIFARPEDPADLREVLQRELGLNKVDAGISAHHAPGILPQPWPRDLAERAAAAISAAGLKAITVDQSEIPDLAHSETTHHLRCQPDGLELCDLSGAVDRTWDWSELMLVSVGRVPLEEQRHYVTDTIAHANPVPADEYLRGGAVHGFEAWMIFDNPLRILHCDSEHMNYEYLGDRKAGSGTANFELLVADIAVHASQAFLTPATRKYLTRGPVLDYDFRDSLALREYTVTEYLLSRQFRT